MKEVPFTKIENWKKGEQIWEWGDGEKVMTTAPGKLYYMRNVLRVPGYDPRNTSPFTALGIPLPLTAAFLGRQHWDFPSDKPVEVDRLA